VSCATSSRSACSRTRTSRRTASRSAPRASEGDELSRRLTNECDELSRRLANECVTLLKNDDELLPLGRDVAKVAVIGPHADSTMLGFPHYSYPAGVAMIRVAAKLGFFPMPLIYPFSDAEALACQLPAARPVGAHSIVELVLAPTPARRDRPVSQPDPGPGWPPVRRR